MTAPSTWQTRGMRLTLELLEEADGSMTRQAIIAELDARLEPSDEDRQPGNNGLQRWFNAVGWGTSILSQVGWMVKAKGNWHLTEAGRDALRLYPTPELLREAAVERYSALKAKQSEVATRRAWQIRGSSVLGQNLVPTWLDEGWCSLAASQLPKFDTRLTSDGLAAVADHAYEHLKQHRERREKVEEIVDFVARMKMGDVVLTTDDAGVFVGKISGDAVYQTSDAGRSNLRRSVEWRNPDVAIDFGELPASLQARLKTGATLADITSLITEIDELEQDITTPATGAIGDDTSPDKVLSPQHRAWITRRSRVAVHHSFVHLAPEVADELFVSQAWLDEFVDVLNERRQVVFYGPPGTGKTYLARRIAAHLVGEQQVRLVQFHPSYSYEDFFEGFRPGDTANGTVTLELRPGPLRRLADEAREHPDQAFVLVIDELNRANLAKVFGELYFLLEYRDQAVELLYGGEPFTLPTNLYFIGTMNTADRSIALLDAAMRRRFAFIELHPATEPTAGLLAQWLDRKGLPDLAARMLAVLNSRIDDRDAHIGPSYFMQSDQSHLRLARVWRTQITPLLQEYHYDQWDSVAHRFSFDSVAAAAGYTSGPTVTPAGASEPSVDTEP